MAQQERHGAAHRITATRTQDQSVHHQPTRAPVNPAVWSGQDWVDRTSGRSFNADEVEEMGLDPSLRSM